MPADISVDVSVGVSVDVSVGVSVSVAVGASVDVFRGWPRPCRGMPWVLP